MHSLPVHRPTMIIGFFGRPGSGKTLALTTIIKKHYDAGRIVFSTYKTAYSIYVDFIDIASMSFPKDSVFVLDEVVLYADNRAFKTFPKGAADWLMNHRHYFQDVYWASQHFEAVDKKIRIVTDRLYKIRVTFPSRVLTRLFPKFFGLTVLASRFVPDTIYDELQKSLVDGYLALPLGFAGILQRILRPGYWRVKYRARPVVLKSYDTHDDQIGYWNRPLYPVPADYLTPAHYKRGIDPLFAPPPPPPVASFKIT